MNIEITRCIRLRIGETELVLTMEEAKELYRQLSEIFGTVEHKSSLWIETRRGFQKGTLRVSNKSIQKVKSALSETQFQSVEDIAKKAGISTKTAYSALTYLMDVGYVQIMKQGRRILYRRRPMSEKIGVVDPETVEKFKYLTRGPS